VLGGLWWALEDGARVLYACRAAALIVAVGAVLIALTDQARDMVLITAHDATAWEQAGLVACVLAWATASWFWSRLTLDLAFASPSPPDGPPWRDFVHSAWVSNMPRLIGAAAIWSLAVAFFRSAATLRLAGSEAAGFYEIRGWICVLGGVLFYVVVIVRRPVMRWIARIWSGEETGTRFAGARVRYGAVRQVLGRSGLALLLLSLVFTPAFSFWFWVDPVAAAAFFGDAVRAVLFGLALMVSVLSALVLYGERRGVPAFSGVLLAALLVPAACSDNHDVRLCRDGANCANLAMKPDPRMSLRNAFYRWWDENSAAELTKPIDTKGGPDMVVPPMILVATAGGASRAAYWTTQVLGELAGREPHFAQRLFMISGVSGGSLGATVFRSLIEEDRRNNGGFDSRILPGAAERGGKFMSRDFLGPAMATGLYVDLPISAFSFSRDLLPFDRAVALEKAWEHAWKDQRRPKTDKARFDWSEGFVGTLGASQRPWPILALNGTSVEKGRRMITSNVGLWEGTFEESMSQPEIRYDTLSMLRSDVPISTAVTMSARFPVISPSGGLRDRDGKPVGRIVDGGLFENFGALTVDEVMRYVAHRLKEARRQTKPVVPIVILVSSDPTLDPLMSHEKQYNGDELLIATARSEPDCDSLDGEKTAEPIPAPGHEFLECPYRPRQTAQSLIDAALALYTGRTARGEAVASSLLGRLKDLNRSIYDDLSEKIDNHHRENGLPIRLPGQPSQIFHRMGGTEEAGFFHFRQCRLAGRKSPTMSWHNSERGRETMRIMTGLGGDRDPKRGRIDHDASFRALANLDVCGNAAEFFRLCVKLARVAEGLNEDEATAQCGVRWPEPSRAPASRVGG
jgi:hypothetical protein